jgi:hypothetical protein
MTTLDKELADGRITGVGLGGIMSTLAGAKEVRPTVTLSFTTYAPRSP